MKRSKQFDKSGFDKLVQLLELLLAGGNDCFCTVEYSNNFGLTSYWF